MAFKGINFRSTAAFVTDGTDETYSIGEIYPTTRGGMTFGWVGAANTSKADRNATHPVHCAGINFATNSGSKKTFRIDLPSTGDATIRAAFGDLAGAQTHTVAFKDNGTSFATHSAVATTTGQFLDAAGNKWIDTGFDANNVTISHTFTSTVFEVEIGAASGTAATTISHLAFEITASAADAYTLTGPSTGTTGVASSNFTVTPNGAVSADVVVTPSDGGDGGTFSPTSVTFASGTSTAQTFTYAAATAGAKTISTTNDGSLTDPTSLTYTASDAATFQAAWAINSTITISSGARGA